MSYVLHGAVREYVINLRETASVNVTSGPAVDDVLLIFWIGAKLNHYQYHLIWEPGCHRASFISNSQLDFTVYHSIF